MKIPQTIAVFVNAINHQNKNELRAAFNDNALISDEGHDYRGVEAIKEWFQQKCLRANVTLEPVNTFEKEDRTIVTMKVDGTFDKTGLPDPLHLEFHFTNDSEKISALRIQFPESSSN